MWNMFRIWILPLKNRFTFNKKFHSLCHRIQTFFGMTKYPLNLNKPAINCSPWTKKIHARKLQMSLDKYMEPSWKWWPVETQHNKMYENWPNLCDPSSKIWYSHSKLEIEFSHVVFLVGPKQQNYLGDDFFAIFKRENLIWRPSWPMPNFGVLCLPKSKMFFGKPLFCKTLFGKQQLGNIYFWLYVIWQNKFQQ